ncbi:sulfate transporter subunit [Desulfuribacillus alkaliarsenatis]|uniref:Sulfate transporter subunit n=1 Tax=Desulfuribacillus alkaliarsenatis TaxID=766136 RepID=A0A1E5FZ26_9FIRM|nr:sulfate ABC transporter substrate-binding protein [Desulfuribacillus alkaliarsenatis]OEF95836.1 sulfate transporter subunit [Desulfuribacillus alkaliarsenatis]
MRTIFLLLVGIIGVSIVGCGLKISNTDYTLLNVSYDPTREFYRDFNQLFIEYWEQETGGTVHVLQSHGGAGSQARAVIEGLAGDVVTMALAYDIDMIHKLSNLLPSDWEGRLPYNSTPYTSTIVFLVREGNPKNITDWDDLIRDDVAVITPSPKTSGGARWNYLAAWGYAMNAYGNDEKKALEFITKLYKNVPVLDAAARGATTTFVERDIGDVFITWENEAYLAIQEIADKAFEIVVPSVSILCEPPVALVDKNAKRKGNYEVAQAYLEHLYTEEAQHIIAKHYFRPRNEQVLNQYRHIFADVELFTIDDEMFGGWTKAHETHFSDRGYFDKIYRP